ncbi:YwqH-like family protein [Fictibacillus phosphorivorans]|uniref:YwqH-like family protein n=1 Tax=Fictibacillus phosphorivorans TaxID=1221500 RepID=UPI003CE71701
MLSYYYAMISKAREDQKRLYMCQSKLMYKQHDFILLQNKCLDPELSPSTWHGQHAMQFQSIRESGIKADCIEISSNQFEAIFDMISSKIAMLNAEISSLQQSISNYKEDLKIQ